MATGILCILTAALCNSVGYLFSARFLLHHKSPLRLLVVAQIGMMLLSLPCMLFVFPFGQVQNMKAFMTIAAFWVFVFLTGQGCFFFVQRFFESSRLSSLLGLKMIVLTAIFIIFEHGIVNKWQWFAVCLAALAAMVFNWSGGKKMDHRGWIILLLTLICYSLADINETKMITLVRNSGFGLLRSALSATFFLYFLLGLVTLPFLFLIRPDVSQFKMGFPYSAIWLASQIFLLAGFALVKPVFGNVILATRGIFSVLLGVLLPFVGLASLDSNIPASKWIQRAIAAVMMTSAIVIYSCYS